MNKKYLPFILLGVGILVFLGIVLMIRRANSAPGGVANQEDSGVIPEIPADQMPTAALISSVDGHTLTLKINGIKVTGATSMDYELLYKVANGTTQGVPGSIQLNGQTSISRDMLLGSESSGKKRYDVGVETGSLALRFRDANGKLLGKLATDFHLQSATTALTSVDGKFKYILSSAPSGVFFITMQTFGNPDPGSVVVASNGYAVYASDGSAHAGKLAS